MEVEEAAYIQGHLMRWIVLVLYRSSVEISSGERRHTLTWEKVRGSMNYVPIRRDVAKIWMAEQWGLIVELGSSRLNSQTLSL